jgi:hypothetical protein
LDVIEIMLERYVDVVLGLDLDNEEMAVSGQGKNQQHQKTTESSREHRHGLPNRNEQRNYMSKALN